MKTKKSSTKLSEPSAEPTFPKTLHRLRKPADATAKEKPQKREKIFSKSKDLREDRSTRQNKISHSRN